MNDKSLSSQNFNIIINGKWRVEPLLNVIKDPNGEITTVEPRVMNLLVYFCKHPGKVLTREEILENVWPDTFVTDSSLSASVSILRKIIDRDEDEEFIIQTIRKVGYRMMARVEFIQPDKGQQPVVIHEGEPENMDTTASDYFDNVQLPRIIVLMSGFIVLGLIIAGSIFSLLGTSESTANTDAETRNLQLKMLVNSNLNESSPSVYWPDSTVVYAVRHDWLNKTHLYFNSLDKMIGTEMSPNSDYSEDKPAWAPDGKKLAFYRYRENHCRIILKYFPEGNEHTIAECNDFNELSSLTWSNNGDLIAFTDLDPASSKMALYLLNANTLEKEKLTGSISNMNEDYAPKFSVNDRYIYFIRGVRDNHYLSDLFPRLGLIARINLQNQAVITLSSKPYIIAGYDLTDNNELIVFENLWNKTRIKLIDAADGKTITESSYNYILRNPEYDKVSGQIVLEKWEPNFFNFTLRNVATQSEKQRVFILNSTNWEWDPDYNSDGTYFSFATNRDQKMSIYISSRDIKNVYNLPPVKADLIAHPKWSPDDKSIVFESYQSNNANLSMFSTYGGKIEKVTSWQSFEILPSWSQDGKSVYFSSDSTGNWEIWKKNLETGFINQVTTDGGLDSREIMLEGNPYLVFTKPGHNGIWMQSIENGNASILVPELSKRDFTKWDIINNNIHYVRREINGDLYLYKYNIKTGDQERLDQFSQNKPATFTRLAVSPLNGSTLYTGRTISSDLVSIDLNELLGQQNLTSQNPSF